jgi:DNA-binding MarR family transcriptional regulator
VTTRDKILGAPIEQFTRMMFTRVITALSRTLRDEELSVAQVAALHLLDQGKTSSVTALGAELGLSPSAVSRLVDGLVQRDLVVRAEDPEDRRKKTLMLTPKGRRFVDAASEDRVRVMLAATESLPARLVERILTVVNDWKPTERSNPKPHERR